MPTFAEAGVTDFVIESWIGVFAPKGLPAADVARFEAAVNSAATSADGRTKLLAVGAEPMDAGAAAFDTLWRGDMRKWKTFIAESGIKTSEF